MVRLEHINAENVWDIIDLAVAESQKEIVAPNTISIIEAYTSIGTGCTAFPFAIFDDDTPVGFLMLGHNIAALFGCPDIVKNSYLLWRLMIDEKHQKKGYGREATRLAIEFVKTFPCGPAEYLVTSYEPENTVAQRLYQSFGFVETGDVDEEDGELIAAMKL